MQKTRYDFATLDHLITITVCLRRLAWIVYLEKGGKRWS